MIISRIEAKKKIKEIVNEGKPVKTGVKLPIKIGETFNVYKIPLDYLVPNILNDRIAWKIREFEANNDRKLNIENEEDINYVRKLLLDEHPSENKNTMKDIALKGQQNHGVITNDGIIIDGNRRAMLILKLFQGEARNFNKNIEEFRYFEAIVLGEDVSDSEIMALETSLQIGEDSKVGYDPINIYIKVDNLFNSGYTAAQIAQYMNENESTIKDKVEIFKVMNQYLEFINKKNHFTLLSGLEDHFIKCETVFKKMEAKTYPVNWEYDESDIVDFKQVAFDYMRAKHEGKSFRDELIGKTTKPNGVFCEEDNWREFLGRHNEIINNSTLEKESDYKLLEKQLSGNLKRTINLLEDTLNQNSFSDTIKQISKKLENLEGMLKNKNDMTDDDYNNLHTIEKRIYEIRKDFK